MPEVEGRDEDAQETGYRDIEEGSEGSVLEFEDAGMALSASKGEKQLVDIQYVRYCICRVHSIGQNGSSDGIIEVMKRQVEHATLLLIALSQSTRCSRINRLSNKVKVAAALAEPSPFCQVRMYVSQAEPDWSLTMSL